MKMKLLRIVRVKDLEASFDFYQKPSILKKEVLRRDFPENKLHFGLSNFTRN